MSEGAHLVDSQFVKKRYENNLKSIKIFSTSYNIYFMWIRLLINYSLRSLITPLNPTPPPPLQQAQTTRTLSKHADLVLIRMNHFGIVLRSNLPYFSYSLENVKCFCPFNGQKRSCTEVWGEGWGL